MRTRLHALSEQDEATILAALRFYLQNGQGEMALRNPDVHATATCGGRHPALATGSVEELFSRIDLQGFDLFLTVGVDIEGDTMWEIGTSEPEIQAAAAEIAEISAAPPRVYRLPAQPGVGELASEPIAFAQAA
ncbi:hypothetical protein [Microvirga tunisiensis]|uniref:Uncharacterized protein n=1 Tax=Microvirga tunisiensis TaxID=2108360 RepID=A0A5N7MNX9_9HYPH|nr:hypothetical protein [Microvirga tunisiensis]MPR11498.1 hypothetical protein [Microvirga tunisiensis]MPR28623.1 hypothetical protein [Microvirga tunisiensis]